MIGPRHIFLIIGFILSILAYSPLCDLYTIEGFNLHSKLMAITYVCVLHAAWRMNHEPLTRLFVNIFLGAAVGNLADELFFDNTTREWPEYTLGGIWIISSIVAYILKRNNIQLNGSRVSRRGNGTRCV
jgi:hypothetical protein